MNFTFFLKQRKKAEQKQKKSADNSCSSNDYRTLSSRVFLMIGKNRIRKSSTTLELFDLLGILE